MSKNTQIKVIKEQSLKKIHTRIVKGFTLAFNHYQIVEKKGKQFYNLSLHFKKKWDVRAVIHQYTDLKKSFKVTATIFMGDTYKTVSWMKQSYSLINTVYGKN